MHNQRFHIVHNSLEPSPLLASSSRLTGPLALVACSHWPSSRPLATSSIRRVAAETAAVVRKLVHLQRAAEVEEAGCGPGGDPVLQLFPARPAAPERAWSSKCLGGHSQRTKSGRQSVHPHHPQPCASVLLVVLPSSRAPVVCFKTHPPSLPDATRPNIHSVRPGPRPLLFQSAVPANRVAAPSSLHLPAGSVSILYRMRRS